MTIAETILLRSAIADLREAVVAYGKLASYVSQYPQYGWMELDASHSILFSRIEAFVMKVSASVYRRLRTITHGLSLKCVIRYYTT